MTESFDDKSIFLEQKNKFSTGDEIEIMKKDGRNEKTKVLRIEDEDGNEMESCPHAKQRIRVFLSVLPDNGDILRILNDTETV